MGQYEFHSPTATDFNDTGSQITQGIRFGEFDTIKEELYLLDRSADAPKEKEVTESIAFQQGIYDFSQMTGERIFENRDVVFKFMLFNRKYNLENPNDRIRFENRIKKLIMPLGVQALYDTHNPTWYLLGKATGITLSHEENMNRVTVTLTFSCYPFMIDSKPESSDIWDNFDFENDIAQELTYQIAGTESLTLFNVGAAGVTPEVKTTAAMTVVSSGNQIKLPAGTTTSELIRLAPGENLLTVTGTGTISFDWHKEMMV